MAHNPHQHLQREIDSLRKQLITERDSRRYDDALHITTVIKEAEARMLERCIVECMEEANAPTYTEEERIAILTATERLKEMRKERMTARESAEAQRRQIQQKEMQSKLYEQMLNEKTRAYDRELRRQMDASILKGLTATQVIMDETGNVRWSKVMNPEEWMK